MTILRLLIKLLNRINQATLFCCKYSTIVLVMVITAIVCAGVFWRYFLNDSLSWTEETAKFLMVWMVFTGCPIALKQHGHAAIEALPNALTGRLRQALQMVIYCVIVVMMALLVKYGWKFMLNARVQETATTQISMMYVFASMPFGGLAMGLIALEFFFKSLLGIIIPEQGMVPPSDSDMASASSGTE